jgi:signal transduction histidine kinase
VAGRARDYQGADVQLSGVHVNGWWGRSALERALENIVGNAHKYGDPGTPIEVTLAGHDGRAVVSVRNQGKPIPMRMVSETFTHSVRMSLPTQENSIQVESNQLDR